jgi:hypothetical protein
MGFSCIFFLKPLHQYDPVWVWTCQAFVRDRISTSCRHPQPQPLAPFCAETCWGRQHPKWVSSWLTDLNIRTDCSDGRHGELYGAQLKVYMEISYPICEPWCWYIYLILPTFALKITQFCRYIYHTRSIWDIVLVLSFINSQPGVSTISCVVQFGDPTVIVILGIYMSCCNIFHVK